MWFKYNYYTFKNYIDWWKNLLDKNINFQSTLADYAICWSHDVTVFIIVHSIGFLSPHQITLFWKSLKPVLTHRDAVVDFLSHIFCNQLKLFLCDVLHWADNVRFALRGSWGSTALWSSTYLTKIRELYYQQLRASHSCWTRFYWFFFGELTDLSDLQQLLLQAELNFFFSAWRILASSHGAGVSTGSPVWIPPWLESICTGAGLTLQGTVNKVTSHGDT